MAAISTSHRPRDKTARSIKTGPIRVNDVMITGPIAPDVLCKAVDLTTATRAIRHPDHEPALEFWNNGILPLLNWRLPLPCFMAKCFNDSDREAVYRAIYERRDMRHFVPDPVDPTVLQRLLDAAHHAPSVGYMQPWRILRITDASLRHALHDTVESERLATADALGKRREEFMKLKVEGMLECGELLVMALMDGREKHIFGRRTLPEMDLASVACAIQNMWLAARAEGLGMGWVSLFDVDAVRALLRMPQGARPVAILCLGHVDQFYSEPMLETERWASRMPLSDCVFDNYWPQTDGPV